MTDDDHTLANGLAASTAEADEQFSAQPVGGNVVCCVQDLRVTYNAGQSELQELWDLWIEERPAESIARFDLVTDPPQATVSCTAEVLGPSGVIKSNAPVTSPTGSSALYAVSWNGTNDAGLKVATGTYRIRLTASTPCTTARAVSADIKVLRVGIVYIRFRNVYPLKFAFRNYPASFVTDNFDVPPAEWRIASLDDGTTIRTPPSCSTRGRSADVNNYCYPFAAKRRSRLRFRVGTEGRNYSSGDGIRMRVVGSGREDSWSDDAANGIDIHQEYWFEANPANRMFHRVAKRTDLHFDLLFEYTNSLSQVIRLGRQCCSRWVVYVIVSMPTEPWGMGNTANRQRPWVELLEQICTGWATGAQTVEQAAGNVVSAVNGRMSLRYDTTNGADVNSLVTKSSGVPSTIRLRAFLNWLGGDSSRPATWNIVNCTCCGALVSTIANSIGCSIHSSVLTDNSWSGFGCHQIISIGFSNWNYPFPNPTHTAGGFRYHEVAWTGTAGDSEDIYDACLQVATDPVSAPTGTPLFARQMVYNSGVAAVNDYERRLIVSADVARVRPQSHLRGRYRAT